MAKELRTGFTTGTCASAAAKAAALMLTGETVTGEVDISLPGGDRVTLPLEFIKRDEKGTEAGVKKYAGDDPDVTDGVTVIVSVAWASTGDVTFEAGDGVGTITKKGLSTPEGEPAINPTPRLMITNAIREVTQRPVKVTVSIPGGEMLAEKTFNPRLGIVNGLSILGTSGIVRPYSCPALRQALKCSIDVAEANDIKAPVFTPGNIGRRAASDLFNVSDKSVIEISNEWGIMLDYAVEKNFSRLLLIGHPGKLAKLAEGVWDTHSSRSKSAVLYVTSVAKEIFKNSLMSNLMYCLTVEGVFGDLTKEEGVILADELSKRIRDSVTKRIKGKIEISVALVNMQGELIGHFGEMEPWRK